MTLIAWLFFGLVIGAIASALNHEEYLEGIVGNILFALSGALLGGMIANVWLGNMFASATALLVIALSSLSLLLVGRQLSRV